MMIMNKSIHFLLCIVFLCNKNCSSEPCKPKIAIIGAGIGGASASYFLEQLFDQNVKIDIFESKHIGGRLTNIELGGELFEAGGSIIHSRNKYMKQFVNLLNLNKRPPFETNFGIWNGKEFVLKESSWTVITLSKLFYRYGLQPFYLYRYVTTILDDFENIYKLQDNGIAFDNVTTLLSAMNEKFVNLIHISIKEYLTNLGYGIQIIDELVEATLVVNYGQDTDVHAFVGLVSLAGAGSDLWSVKGGNKKVPEGLILKNKRASFIHATVTMVKRQSSKNLVKYEVYYKLNGEKKVNNRTYDIVILAAPIINDHETPIIFEGFKNPDLMYLGEYQTTFATFVTGDVNFTYFGLQEEIGGIMSCKPIDTKISSIGKLSSVEGKKNNLTKVWKIFSRQKLDNSIITKMFLNVAEIKEIRWKAYPQYLSVKQLNKFKLDNSLYYINAIEWAASAMEMSAISGRNAAILAFNDYQKACSSSDSEDKSSTNEDIQTHPEL